MKPFLILSAVLLCTTFACCRNLGYNDQSANTRLTPEVSETEQVRTYDQNGNPTVTNVVPPSKTDPSSPDYQAPAPAK